MMIKPLLKIITFIVFFLFTASTFAEYYIVYPGGCRVGYAPCKVYKKKYKRHKKRTHCRSYKKRSGGRMVKYHVYPTCNGAYWVPKCRYSWGSPPPCRTGCRDFYVPPEYFYRSRYHDSYYYDPAIDWDMRTMDDY